MLEYAKIILNKVSFDSTLFEKEFKKSLFYLMPEEIDDLLQWVEVNYIEYSDIINNIKSL